MTYAGISLTHAIGMKRGLCASVRHTNKFVLRLPIEKRTQHVWRELYGLLFNACAAERWEMRGVLHQPNPHRVYISHTVIPAEYFNDLTYHIMGKGYYGNGQIGPDLSARQTFDSMFSDRDDAAPLRRPIYVLARIRRSDALELKSEFDPIDTTLGASSASDVGNGEIVSLPSMVGVATNTAKAGSDCRKYLTCLMSKSPKRRLGTKDEIFADASVKYPGLSRRAFDRAWADAVIANRAHAWSRAGAPQKIVALGIPAAK